MRWIHVSTLAAMIFSSGIWADSYFEQDVKIISANHLEKPNQSSWLSSFLKESFTQPGSKSSLQSKKSDQVIFSKKDQLLSQLEIAKQTKGSPSHDSHLTTGSSSKRSLDEYFEMGKARKPSTQSSNKKRELNQATEKEASTNQPLSSDYSLSLNSSHRERIAMMRLAKAKSSLKKNQAKQEQLLLKAQAKESHRFAKAESALAKKKAKKQIKKEKKLLKAQAKESRRLAKAESALAKKKAKKQIKKEKKLLKAQAKESRRLTKAESALRAKAQNNREQESFFAVLQDSMSQHPKYKGVLSRVLRSSSSDVLRQENLSHPLMIKAKPFIAQIRTSFDKALYEKEKLEIVETTLKDLQDLEHKMIYEEAFGLSSDLDKLNAQLNIGKWQVKAIEQRKVFNENMRSLSNLVGMDISSQWISGSLEDESELILRELDTLALKDDELAQVERLGVCYSGFKEQILPLKKKSHQYMLEHGGVMQLEKQRLIDSRNELAQASLSFLENSYSICRLSHSGL